MAQVTCVSTEGIRKYLNHGRSSFQVAEIKRIWSHSCWNLGQIWTDTLGELQLYVTSGEHCTKLYVVDDDIIQEQVDELSCDHEEADTRLLLHAEHAERSGYPSVVIKSPDTDLFVLALFSKLALPETSVFMHTGTGDRSRIVSVDVVSR